MSSSWAAIAMVGRVIAVVTVLPFLGGMLWLLVNGNPNVEMVEQASRLFAGAVVALVPLSLGGIALYALFQAAEARA
ncbi:hypothetical protein [Halorarius halobius]|uniref:hypothetical protein n=1 Tax=Halorarius halobius TaxID=2962671 RepID=UPI0020CD6EB6|nr:hypothetical protein [Halorarius halobius]